MYLCDCVCACMRVHDVLHNIVQPRAQRASCHHDRAHLCVCVCVFVFHFHFSLCVRVRARAHRTSYTTLFRPGYSGAYLTTGGRYICLHCCTEMRWGVVSQMGRVARSHRAYKDPSLQYACTRTHLRRIIIHIGLPCEAPSAHTLPPICIHMRIPYIQSHTHIPEWGHSGSFCVPHSAHVLPHTHGNSNGTCHVADTACAHTWRTRAHTHSTHTHLGWVVVDGLAWPVAQRPLGQQNARVLIPYCRHAVSAERACASADEGVCACVHVCNMQACARACM